MKTFKMKNICPLKYKSNHDGHQSKILHAIGKAFGLIVCGLLLLTAANLNVRGQAADTFNPNVTVPPGNILATVQTIVRQLDGKILIGGIFTSVGGQTHHRIVRLNTDGTRDLTFNSPFIVNNQNSVRSIALQPDGKILIGGFFVQDPQQGTSTSIMRLNADGSLDSSFNQTVNGDVKAVLVLTDGKILIGGAFDRIGTSSNFITRPYFARLNSDGSLDTAFNPVGNLQYSITSGGGGAGGVHRIIQQPDGKILIGGWFSFSNFTTFSRYGIARLATDGTFDSFNPVLPVGGLYAVTLQPDGKVLIGGGGFNTVGGVGRKNIARVNADGTLDVSFDAMFTEVPNNLDVRAISLQADGKILVGGGFINIGGQTRYGLARLNPNGNADNFVSNNGNSNGGPNAIVVQPDGKILVGGSFSMIGGQPRNNIARLYSSEIGEGTQPIIFSTNRDGNSELYKMNADGTNQQRLTDSPENETFGQWSPDGTKILFSKAVSSTQIQIWTMNADGSNKTLISDATGQHFLYKWSPNGQKILYGRRESSAVENLWTMNADGSGKSQLTNAGTIDHIADWSPDSSKIAFGRCNPTFVCDIFTMNTDGTNQINLTPTNPNDDDAPKWTNDGSKIVFGAQTSPDDYNVYIMNANGTNRQPLTTSVPPQFYTPSEISPNGNKLAMDFRGSVINSFEISTINLDGSNLLNLTNNSVFDGFGAWSPDSAKIAFRSRRDTATDEIYTMNADGSNVVRLTFNTATDFVTDWRREPIKRAPFDFDGDGRTDVSIFRPSVGEWWYLRSSDNNNGVLQFGTSTDKLAPADYTGDGKTDITFFRPSTGFWFILRSEDFSFLSFPFGTSGDIPTPADYDGDGKADPAVFRPSTNTWFISNSGGGTSIVTFGTTGDKPVTADYDGDGKSDVAIFRPSDGSWWYLQSSNSQTKVYNFGASTDKPVQGDYTGDGKADIAVFRPSTGEWFVQRSEDNSFYSFPFGAVGDIPTPGDYDGDGKFDAAVFRPSNSTWFLKQSTAGIGIVTFGITGDVPVPNAFVP